MNIVCFFEINVYDSIIAYSAALVGVVDLQARRVLVACTLPFNVVFRLWTDCPTVVINVFSFLCQVPDKTVFQKAKWRGTVFGFKFRLPSDVAFWKAYLAEKHAFFFIPCDLCDFN